MESIDLTQKNIEGIGALFPNVITEMKDENGKLKKGINFELLKQELSSDVVDGEECFDFTWVGKKAAIVEANSPIRMTLRPCIEESEDWENTGNLYIEGDNLNVLKLLQESYLNSIKMIYIDPPYNTGKDFIYRDNFTINKNEYDEELGLYDENDNRLFQNSESNGRFHSDWCSMLYPRLKLASNLLRNDGVIFISIDDNELENMIKICNDVFGESNFIDIFSWKKTETPANLSRLTKKAIEYVVAYKKTDELEKLVGLKKESKSSNGLMNQTNSAHELLFPANVVDTGIKDGIIKEGKYGTNNYEILLLEDTEVKEGVFIKPVKLFGKFKWAQDNLNREISKGTKISIRTTALSPSYEREEYEAEKPWNIIDRTFGVGTNENASKELDDLIGINIFDFPKPTSLIKYLVNSCTTNSDIVLDFFSGSATTAHSVMQLNSEDGSNRKFIMVQLPEKTNEQSAAYKAGYVNICEIGKDRIRRAGQNINKEILDNNSQLKAGEEEKCLVDVGFRVLKADTTNMKDVYYAANEYSQSMLAGLESNIKDERTDLDLLYGVLLDWGLPLSLSHKIEEIDGVSVHTVDEGSLIACFADRVSESIIREIAKRQPLRVVFRDSSFVNSPDKINVEEIFKLHAPNTTVKVI